MYNPPANRVDVETGLDLVDRSGFGQLISVGSDGLQATGLPLLLDRSAMTLRGHFARANDHWADLDGVDVLVLFALSDGYVSPGDYPSKAGNARVVPTWNYEVVHVHGQATVHDDKTWVRQLVSDLTDHHESRYRNGDAQEIWQVSDAPDEFIDGQLRAIVGVEIAVDRIEAKRKLSQNRSDIDRRGVIDAHAASGQPTSTALAAAMRSTDGWDTSPGLAEPPSSRQSQEQDD